MDFRENHLSEYSLRSKLHTESVTHYNRTDSAITLIALVVTIIVLLILAGVSLSLIVGGDGILGKAESAVDVTDEAKAKEKLEIVLAGILADKYTDENYNTGNYIDEKIIENEMFVSDNVVTVDGWQFEIDRSKPKIINALGKGQESEEIEILTDVQYNSTFSQAKIKFRINYEGNLKNIQINGENQEILSNELTKTVDKNGTYQIYVKYENDAYKLAKAEVTELAEDMEIRTAEDLVAFRDKVNKGATFEGKTVTLMNDLDLSSVCSEEKGSWTPIGLEAVSSFKGTFDGKGHTISNIYYSGNLRVAGLFAMNGGNISNLIIESSAIEVTNEDEKNPASGAITGYNYGSIENCKIKNTVSITVMGNGGAYAGGVVGISSGYICDCANEGTIKSSTNVNIYNVVGGIVGGIENEEKKQETSIERCYNAGDIIIESASTLVNNAPHAGGIVGQLRANAKAKQCYNIGKVTSKGKGNYPSTGGIVGLMQTSSIVEECYNLGKINYTSENNVYSRLGGIVGSSDEKCIIRNCYNIGETSSSSKGTNYVGGVSGCIQMETNFENCYALTGKGATEIYGVKGEATVTNCSMKSKTDLKNIASTLGSAFVADITNINNGYPVLKWQVGK